MNIHRQAIRCVDFRTDFDIVIVRSEADFDAFTIEAFRDRLLITISMTAAKALSKKIPSETLDMVLAAGGWSSTADDTNQRERLPLDLVRQLVDDYPSDTRSIGLLSVTLGAAKWGVDGDSTLPADPANDGWRGPTRASGKHLMSYKVGGVGLPHFDKGALANFIDFLVAKHPDIGDDAERSRMTQIADSLRDSKKYDQVKSDATFGKWMLEGLRRKDAQQWVLEHWLDAFWAPAYRASAGDIRLALVLARIWNTSTGLGECAAERALKADDHVQAALEAYVDCPGGKTDYKGRRWGWMKRPVVLFDAYATKTP